MALVDVGREYGARVQEVVEEKWKYTEDVSFKNIPIVLDHKPWTLTWKMKALFSSWLSSLCVLSFWVFRPKPPVVRCCDSHSLSPVLCLRSCGAWNMCWFWTAFLLSGRACGANRRPNEWSEGPELGLCSQDPTPSQAACHAVCRRALVWESEKPQGLIAILVSVDTKWELCIYLYIYIFLT